MPRMQNWVKQFRTNFPENSKSTCYAAMRNGGYLKQKK
jgi:hypothetical protein